MDKELEVLTGGALEADAVEATTASCITVQDIGQINAHLTNLETIGVFVCFGVGLCFGAILTNLLVKLWKV